MRYSNIVFCGLVNLVFAQQEVATVLLLGFDAQGLVGSIIASDLAATTYSIQCAPTVDATDCGVPSFFSLTQGPNTVHYNVAAPTESLTLDANCSLDGTTLAVCSGGYIGAGATGADAITTSATFVASDLSTLFQPVPITTKFAANTQAGATATDASDSAASTSSVATTSDSSSPTPTKSSTSGVSGPASAQSSSTSTSTSTAGAPKSTGYGTLMAGGIAAALMAVGL